MESRIVEFACGSLAGIVAETVTHPLDSAKTRMQLHLAKLKFSFSSLRTPTTQPTVHRGTVRTIVGILREEGLKSLYKGLPPAILRQTIKAGTQMSIYKEVRRLFSSPTTSSPLYGKVASAATAGIIGQFLGNPADIIKVRLQADGQRLLRGELPRYKGMFDAFVKVAQSKGGVSAFWNGCVPAMSRAAVSAGSGLAMYDHTKQLLLKKTSQGDTSLTHLCATAVSSLCSTFCGCPFDVIKTRMMNQSLTNPQYRSNLNCLVQTMRGEGFLSLYKGFWPTYFRVGPWQFVFFLSYENISKFFTGTTL